ncbi:HAD-IA family hydrolase [Plantibacter sp. VKM Ac-2880]|uniref:HAD-IA family hydrolase n=1 Tax=Plantibacter sp. VKM Ac-2880 TaxID=2783827 RepID=UPI00188FB779|nr:HAD-IA family hydrolase [Plantibacter sp. VKM Ac-2880]MBF4567597.1 HAD-IA family hydrolase [Plantibacter sp. VKM Ac-2880]
MIHVVLFDLDGLVRHFDPAFMTDLEHRRGVNPGSIERVAFSKPLIEEVTTGRITRDEWVRRVGETLGDHAAAEEWGRHPSIVDDEVLDLSDEIRGLGLRTAILTNGTDTIAAEVDAHGFAGRFDAIFNSAVIGFAKPDVRAFQHVLEALDVTGDEVFFTDDTASKLVGADAVGMRTHHFHGVRALRAALSAAGVPVGH